EVGVSVTPPASGAGPTIQLTVKAGDVALVTFHAAVKHEHFDIDHGATIARRAGVGVEEVCQRFHCGDFASVHWVALCSSTAQHEPVPKCGSFEVRFSDGTPSKFFYWDDVPGRRLRRSRSTARRSESRVTS